MHHSSKVTELRIKNAPDRYIHPLIHRDKFELTVEATDVGGEPIPYGKALSLPFKAFRVGDAWGAKWDTTWFKFSGEVPPNWQCEEVVVNVNLGFTDSRNENGLVGVEGTVWMDGKPLIGVNKYRQSFPIIESAIGGERIEFYIEAAANPGTALSWGSENLLMPDYDSEPQFRLKSAELATYHDDAFQLLIDYTCCVDAMAAMPEGSMRKAQISRALSEVCDELEESQQYGVHTANEILREIIMQRNGDTVHQVHAIGHAPIDIAWRWSIRETIRKCARTFTAVLRYMERHPDYRFVGAQPVQYLWMRKYFPSIYSDIKGAVKRGQWEIAGGMWVKPDCNLASGESLIRQILHGKNFMFDEFDVDAKYHWMPNAFAYPAGLPQILKKSGIEWMLAQEMSGIEKSQFPHDSFQWEGVDGSEVFTHIPSTRAEACSLTAEEILSSEREFRDVGGSSSSLMPFGHGDLGGGAGPAVEEIERMRTFSDFEGLPSLQSGSVLDFFEHALIDLTEVAVWKGELDLGNHGGSLTSQANVKMMNRHCEFLLRDAEMLQVIMQSLGEAELLEKMPAIKKVPIWDIQGHIKAKQNNLTARALDRAWKLLLLNQSQHILSGSSIHWVYQDCKTDYANIEKIALAIRKSAMEKLSGLIDTKGITNPVLVFNSLAQIRDEVIELPDGDLTMVTVPQCGYSVISTKSSNSEEDENLIDGITAVEVSRIDDGYIVYNGLIRLEINHSGLISSFYDVENSREVIADYCVGNLFQVFKDHPARQNGSDLDLSHHTDSEYLSDHGIVSVVQESKLRAVIHVSRAFGQSQIEQNIVINAGSRRVDFRTEVDWQERERLLKVSFPVNVAHSRASYETQFGHVERSTHRNTSTDVARSEVAAHKWADLSESDYGVALLNNGKYGYDIKGCEMRLTLLRATNAPDPESDRGVHQFTYSLLPHAGSLQQGGVIEQAYALNVPLVTKKTDEHDGDLPAEQSFFSVSKPGIIIETVKKAERSEHAVMRFYDAYQSRGEVSISSSLHHESSASELDLMENFHDELHAENGEVTIKMKPFEVKTIQFS